MDKKLRSIVESVLLVSGDALSYKKLSKIIESEESVTRNVVNQLNQDYLDRKAGFVIIEDADHVQLVSHPENASYVRKLIKNHTETKLSEAASEVLAIIAYKGPLAKVEIENLRGTQCASILRNLSLRGLVERMRDAQNSKLFLYRITSETFKVLGIKKINELPHYGSITKDPRCN